MNLAEREIANQKAKVEVEEERRRQRERMRAELWVAAAVPWVIAFLAAQVALFAWLRSP